MALVIADRVKVTTTTTGTGDLTLGSASTGFQDFNAVGDGNTTYYAVASAISTEWEVGLGTYTASGTTLSRDTILASSNSGSAVNFSAGTKDVFVVAPADKSIIKDASGNVNEDITGNAATATILETARTIGGVSFDGSANINLPGVNTSGNQDTSGNAATATALETARTIAGQSFDGSANISIAPTDLTGVTASAAEINILDGATLDVTELNYVDGVTSSIQTQLDAMVEKAGDTMTGALTLNADPSSALHAATKQYVDTQTSAGIHYHDPVRGETTSNLSATYDNGTSGVGATLTSTVNEEFTYGGISDWSTTERVLIYNQTNGAHNGVYTVTTVGDGGTPWVLTRATDADSAGASDPDALGTGDAFYVQEGNGAGELYVMNTEGTITFGTTDINFTQISSAAIYSAGSGLDLTGTTFSHTDTSSQSSVNNSGNTFIQDVTLDGFGHVTALSSAAVSINDGTLTMATSGTGLSGSASFTANDSDNVTFTVTSNATNANTASTIVARDGSGNFSAGTITAALTGNVTGNVTGNCSGSSGSTTGNAATATKLATSRTLQISGDASGSASFDGSANANISISLAADSVAASEIAANAVGASELNVTGNGTTSQFLRSDGDGTFTWATPTDTNTTYTAGTGLTLTSTSFSVNYGTATGTACQGNDSRLSNSRQCNNSFDNAATARSNLGLGSLATLSTVNASTITDNSVGAAELNVSGNGTTAQFLRSDGDGTFTWATPTDTNTTYSGDGNYGIYLSGTAIRLENDRRRNATGEDVYSGNTHDYTFYDASVGIRWYTAGAEDMRLQDNGDLHVDGNVIAYSTTISDERLKENIVGIDGALDKVSQLNGYTFNYKADGKISAGVIAQEVEKVLPEAVSEMELPLKADDDAEYKVVNYDALHGLLIEAVKELSAKVKELEAKVS
jgi:hypothetical protein